jgi:hypothetical protein
MNPITFRKNPSVAQSVTDLVAEGGNVLASDDAPTAAGQVPFETTMPANTGRPTSQIRVGAGLLAAARRILLRPSVQRRPTLHLPWSLAFTKETKPASQPAPCKVSHRPRARLTFGGVRPANGSS